MNAPVPGRSWALIALCILALVLALRAGGLLTNFEHQAADARARVLQHEVASDIVIVGIDARSLADLQQWPWPRRYHARLLDQLAAAQPARVFLDIDFSSRTNARDDASMADAVSRFPPGRLILPIFAQHATNAASDISYTRPLPELAGSPRLASVNFEQEADGMIRTTAVSWEFEGERAPSAAAAVAGVDWTMLSSTPIDYSISPASFEFVSYVDVLAGRVAPAALRGKTILVGATALELGDLLPTPVYAMQPGVVVQALAAQTLRAPALRPLADALNVAVLVALAALAAFFFSRNSWRRNVLCLALAVAALVLANLYAYASHRLMLELVSPFLIVIACFLAATLRALDQETWRALAYSLGLRRRDALLGSIVRSSADCILCIDAGGRIQMANAAGERLFASGSGQLLNMPVAQLVPALADKASEAQAYTALCGAVTEQQARRLDGSLLPVEISVSPVQLADEPLYTVIIRDISDRKAQESRLRHQATHDPLTGLPNRTALTDYLARALTQTRNGDATALLMLDLCRFKEVNDTLGHHIGDQVLCEVARRFQALAGGGFVARIGGDEFTMVFECIRERDEIRGIAAQLNDALRAPIMAEGVALDLGVSVGVALFPEHAADPPELLKTADVAMYLSKRRGSPCEFYDPAADDNSVRRLAMVSELRRAIGSEGLCLHYQPQVNLKSGRAESVEALLRWRHPDYGLVSPAEFIAIAESTDLIRPLTTWSIEQALRQAREWRRVGFSPRIAVNLSARLLQDADFPDVLRTLLRSYAPAPGSLELEITESAMMQDPARALSVVRAIHQLGVIMSIDDFGTGYSSLSYLRDLPVHALKLDKAFVMHLEKRTEDRSIVNSTVRMAHELGLEVVAEGVETEWAARYLAGAGYDFAQGYLYSTARPAHECRDWMCAFNARKTAVSAVSADEPSVTHAA